MFQNSRLGADLWLLVFELLHQIYMLIQEQFSIETVDVRTSFFRSLKFAEFCCNRYAEFVNINMHNFLGTDD